MPTVTAIERVRFKRRAEVWLDGVRAFSLGLEVIATAGVRVGQALSEQEIADLRSEDERLSAIGGALRLLSLSPRSEQELRQRLRRRGLGRSAVDAAIARVRDLGYLDDAAFARSYIDSRQAATPRSRRALAFELGRKGVDRALVEDAVAAVSDGDAAYEAAQRRLRSLRGLDFTTFQRRLGAFLASRGFGYGVARATIERCWREMESTSQ
jgi:regulatory protein